MYHHFPLFMSHCVFACDVLKTIFIYWPTFKIGNYFSQQTFKELQELQSTDLVLLNVILKIVWSKRQF